MYSGHEHEAGSKVFLGDIVKGPENHELGAEKGCRQLLLPQCVQRAGKPGVTVPGPESADHSTEGTFWSNCEESEEFKCFSTVLPRNSAIADFMLHPCACARVNVAFKN